MKEARHKGHLVYGSFHMISGLDKSRGTESRLEVNQEWGKWEIERDYLMGMECFYEVIKIFLWLYNIVNNIKLYTLKWLLVCYMIFTSVQNTHTHTHTCRSNNTHPIVSLFGSVSMVYAKWSIGVLEENFYFY